MNNETMNQGIAELEAQGWQADAAPRAVEKLYSFPSYGAAMKFLVKLGDRAADANPMPSIRVENGTEVWVRVGRPPSAVLTVDEIELAKKLEVG